MQYILSIQSHVVHGYVGNKAAIFPLQCIGYDVWSINTVQFSNHTGYKNWQGEICSELLIENLSKGIEDLGIIDSCLGILSGYMGSEANCYTVNKIVNRFKQLNCNITYLCDPVMGDDHCYVNAKITKFYKNALEADIITPNQFEATLLSKIDIKDMSTLLEASQYFHNKGIKIVTITGLKLNEFYGKICTFSSNESTQYIVISNEYTFKNSINGSGDLFSSLFLGYYLKDLNIKLALENSVYYVERVLKSTRKSKQRELSILSERYKYKRSFKSNNAIEL